MYFIKRGFIFAFIIMFLFLSACGPDSKTIEIIYNSGGGTLVNNESVEINKPFVLPIEPKKDGYVFYGWYLDDKVFMESFSNKYDLNQVKNNSLNVYANWLLKEYTVIFVTNCDETINQIKYSVLNPLSSLPADPVKADHTFIGWYRDLELKLPYVFNSEVKEDLTLYGKWEVKVIDNSHLATDVLPVFSSVYGNTNGNLNNKGLAVYDTKRSLHYYSKDSSVYVYNPADNETTLLFTLVSKGRPTFLNMDKDILYFIDNSKGHLISYDLEEKVFNLISATENTYASRTQFWVNFVYSDVVYEQENIIFQRYDTSKKEILYSQSYGCEQVNINGTRVYYKPKNSLGLELMNYNGMGKSNIINLVPFGVTEQFESLLYKVDQDYVSYFALIIEKADDYGLYLYNSTEGLVKIMDGYFHSLNYDGKYLYAILGTNLYQIDLITRISEVIYEFASPDAYLNIVNNWLYIGFNTTTNIYRINPVTKKIESLNS